ncbi:hypothetical protein RND71_005265 [Anisodus tanguticus]|uniref:Calmodulin-binding domain-containing protein n=1 Tax=Anisodus tanguticus TaxID=243964 RepID=A0AAE1VLC4_9SOLA|nr:hypothetical protein RND71_005265 [Anisodus tanguticus]
MADMAGGIPESLEKIEPIVSRLRRNSTGSLGFEMGESKVLSRYLGVPTRSCHDMCKHGFEHDSPTKARIPRPTRATLGKIPERKKVPGSTKLPSEIKSQTTRQDNGQELPASTKRAAAFVNHHSDFPSRSHQRRYSDIFIPGRSSKLQESLLDGSSSSRNHSCKTGKDGRASELSKKKSVVTSNVSLSPKSSVKKVLSTTSSNNSPRKASQLNNSRTSLTPSKTGQISHENVTKKTSHLRESKTKSHTTGISQENNNAKESSLDRDGPKRGKTASSSVCSPCSPQSSGGGSSRNIGIIQSSVCSSSLMSPSSNSANESANSDGTGSSTRQNVTTTQKQDIKPQRAGQVGLENEDCGPKVLKFKKGKTIDNQSEISSPRRQNFRQVTVQDKCENENGNGNGNPRGKNLRRSTADGHLDAAKDKVMTVNLRSHAIEDTKETPSLFNNVIEVTASKLAETRRSKVKALVGAFETIISLQDQKSSLAIGRA